ncbi:hypothetical protein SNE40_022937 [Patella caerulea]|uniref:SEC14 domain and spectrin repeat-containing protein 1 n=1 Tax=Patella caerulea TaxID=87958 RepID=A0AAN8G1S3_PATCE
MAYRQQVPPSPSPSQRSDRRVSSRGLQVREGSVRSQQNGQDRRSTTGSSIYGYLIGGRGMEAKDILPALRTGAVVLTGGRDPEGGPIITFPCNRTRIDITHQDISTCLKYLVQIPSEETKRRGFTIIIDNRDGSWSNLVTVLGCLKQCLGDYLKEVYVLQMEYDRRANQRKDSVNIQPRFVVESQLHSCIDRNQLPEEVGGYLTYNHSIWLQNRLKQEKFMRDAQSIVQHLDNEEVKIQRTYNMKDPHASPLEALREHRYFQESIMTAPTEVIRQGRDVLSNLQDKANGRFHSGNESVSTLDNLEAQKQVNRVIQYLENRVDKLQDFLEDRDKSLNMNMQTEEWKRSIKTVVNWILGPGEKLLASRTDIGDSYETAEELRKRHEELQIKCTDTYGQYAELRHQGEELLSEEGPSSSDIRAERDYMDTVCRSFASRLERRKILLITSVRFHRFAEDFSQQLDSLLELLCSDVSAETVTEAEDAIKKLNQMCDDIDHAAHQTLNDGQSLLDEMSRPIKNAFGNDITPDYDSHIKHINQKLEELQERKLRCDELAGVRKLKLQQILQLRTCERDADKAIDWIEELCTVMVTEHQDLGRSPEESETLQDQHKKFESTAVGTYEYGKQLLQGALVLRRSLRYDLAPNNERAYRLEEAWKHFTQGTGERANRLTVASMFMTASDKVNDRIEQILVVISQALDRQITIDEVLTKYQVPKDKVIKDYEDTVQMGKALLDRISLPVLIDDRQNIPRSVDGEKAVDTINTKLRRMDRKAGDLQKYWSELVQNRNNPNFVPKLKRTSSRRKVADIQDPPKRLSTRRPRLGNDRSKHQPQDSVDSMASTESRDSPQYPEIEQRIAAMRSYHAAAALGGPTTDYRQGYSDPSQLSPQSQHSSDIGRESSATRDSLLDQMPSPNDNTNRYHHGSQPSLSYSDSHPSFNLSSSLQDRPGSRNSRSSYNGSQQPSPRFPGETMQAVHSQPVYSSPQDSPGSRNSRDIPGSRHSRDIPGSRNSRSSYNGSEQISPIHPDDKLQAAYAKPVFIEAPSPTGDLITDLEKVSLIWKQLKVQVDTVNLIHLACETTAMLY